MKIKPFEINGKQCVALVRKLTELECFRLMGVDDEDARKMIAAVSRSACYKLAGNSIVAGGNNTDTKGNVDGVLYNIFRKAFVEQENENEQLSLFD